LRSLPNTITRIVVDRLAVSETRLLNLTVAVRTRLDQQGGYRGDLSKAIQLVLRQLIKAKKVVDADGSYSLSKARDRA